jgi:phospholipid/cholesterol/gamma-HCH transport system substrate-binding protein
MKPESKGYLFRIGLLAAMALIVMGLAIIGITSKQRIFERKIEFYTLFPDAAGLKEGSSVWFQGVEVGYVSSIDFLMDPEDTTVKVSYKISSKLLPRINGDTKAVIRSLGLLGDKFISLERVPGKTANPPNLLPGSEIKMHMPVSLKELGQGAQDVMVTINDLSKNLNALVLQFQKGGPLAKIMNDPKLSDELLENSRGIIFSLNKVSAKLEKGEGIAGGLLAKKGEGDQSAMELRESIDRLSAIIQGVDEGKGVLGLLVTELGDGKDARQSLVDFFSALAVLSKSLEDSDSLLHKLVVDEEYGREMSEHLLSINRSLDAILKKVEKGEGTVGGLVNDPSVYNSLSLTAEGMQKSGVVKWYLEKKAKEAAAAEKKAEEGKNKK